jgi:hypothetical protein
MPLAFVTKPIASHLKQRTIGLASRGLPPLFPVGGGSSGAIRSALYFMAKPDESWIRGRGSSATPARREARVSGDNGLAGNQRCAAALSCCNRSRARSVRARKRQYDSLSGRGPSCIPHRHHPRQYAPALH